MNELLDELLTGWTRLFPRKVLLPFFHLQGLASVIMSKHYLGMH